MNPHKPVRTPALWLLGAACALAPFGGGVHVPSLASIPSELGSTGSGASTISVYIFMLAATMIPQGWLSDRLGRRPLALAALATLAVSSVAAAAASSMSELLIARAVQGVAAAGVLVIARAAVRDSFDGREGTRAMSVLSTLQTLGLAFAPVLGAAVGWRWGFGIMGLGAVAILALAMPRWVETRPPTVTREPASAGGFASLWSQPLFLAYALGLAAMASIYFAFIAAGPTMLVGSGQLTPRSFSLVLLGGACACVLGGLFTRTAARRAASGRLALVGAGVVGLAAAGLVTTWATGGAASAWCFCYVLYMFGNGIMIPAAMMSALDVPPQVVGLGASILGTLQFLSGALAAASVDRFSDPAHALTVVASIATVVMGTSLAFAEFRSAATARWSPGIEVPAGTPMPGDQL
ncbi:MFS transporter [Enhygromyxa salina]|uniref:Bicyclomycin resistance protein n=1 Tax=Enhygromyxa salina TaxID=215803 RepID=A0A2S9YSM0_9BACT|nr:MFS transporter [Enhygromyxa salina]PRQ08039.1 Bicyclomycin resistance protein [Enhygromyxa salina]